MLNCMTDHPPLFIKLKNKQSRKLLAVVLAFPTAQPFRDLVHVVFGADAAVERACALVLGLADGAPANEELFGACTGGGECCFEHALREDFELDVSNEGNATPGYGGGPEGCRVGYSSRDCGEMGMCRGKEVEAYLRREDLLG